MFSKITKLFKKVESTVTQNVHQDNLITEEGWFQPLSAEKLLDTPLRQKYLTTIWQNVSMTPEMFDRLYREPIARYAELVQLLPASESHHHSHTGGMLDHGLEVISIAIRLRQSYVLPPNSAPEEQAKQKDIWSAVVIYAALLHDLGKILVDVEIQLKSGRRWYPWLGKPTEPYKFRYLSDRDYGLHPTLGSFLVHYLLPQEAFDWIAAFKQASASFFYFLAGHSDKAGLLADIIQRADQMSVTMALGGDINKLSETPKVSFAKQLQIALVHVVENFKLSSAQGGCDGWLTDDALWVMSKTTADNIRAYLMSQEIAVPSQNGKLFDELQAHHLIETNLQGEAIWYAKVISHTGWAPAKPFTFLKIAPNVIWDNLEKRPTVFNGCIEPTDNQGNILSSDEISQTQQNTVDITPQSLPEPALETRQTEPVVKNQDVTAAESLFVSQAEDEESTLAVDGLTTENNSEIAFGDDTLDAYLDLFPIQSTDDVSANPNTTLVENNPSLVDYRRHCINNGSSTSAARIYRGCRDDKSGGEY